MDAGKKGPVTTSGTDKAQRDRLLIEHLHQVRCIARTIHNRLPQGVALEDLVHSGVLGLIDALHKYNPTKNVQLKSFAKFRIQGAILDSLRELDWCPRALRKRAREFEEAQYNLGVRLGRPASEAELADELGIALAELQRLRRDLCGLDLGTLPSTQSEDERRPDGCKEPANVTDENPFNICLRSEIRELLARAMKALPQREREVLVRYYCSDELTMKEIGALLGVGEARVSQIHSAAIVHLRGRMQELLGSRGPMDPIPRPVIEPTRRIVWKNTQLGRGQSGPSHPPVWPGQVQRPNAPAHRNQFIDP